MQVTIMVRTKEVDFVTTVRISDRCPKCGGKRGKTHPGFAYDGSIRKSVDCWDNPCGHLDTYGAVWEEAKTNGMNKDNVWM